MDPWPYADEEEPSPYRPPTWHCPEGLCECTAAEHQQSAQFAVQLCNELGERMAGARYRIRRGREVMVDGYADVHGWAIVELPHPSRSVRIEWAPGDTPASPRFPFRERYVVKVAAHAPEQANLHRLHNLGFHSWMYTFEREMFGRTENDGGLPFDIYQLGMAGRVTLQLATKDAGPKELEVPLDIPQRPGRYTLWLQSWYP